MQNKIPFLEIDFLNEVSTTCLIDSDCAFVETNASND